MLEGRRRPQARHYRENRTVDAQPAERPGSTVILSSRFTERRARRAARASGYIMTAFEPGARIDRYLVLSHLGGGGMGLVYRAHDTELNRAVALKVLPPPYCRQPEYIERFRAEAQAQARLQSPYIITLYSMLELPAGAVLVLEYVQGETLAQRLRRDGALPPDQAMELFAQALSGLEHMHEMGVVHRDLKPSNIFLNAAGGPVKIMDFGVAKLRDYDAYQHGSMVGTLLYISPEQINGRAVDLRSDIYTLGVSLYEAVTGRLPFESRSDYALMHAHVQENPPAPRSVQRDLPAALERVILKAMEKDPARRFESAAEFRAALLRLGAHPVTTRPANAFGPIPIAAPQRHSVRRVLGGFGVDLLLVATICLLLYTLGAYPGKPPMAETAAAQPAATVRSAHSTPPRRTDDTGERRAARNPTQPPPVKSLDSLRQAWGQ